MSGAPAEHKAHAPRHVRFGLLTVSDSRTSATDRSGDECARLVLAAGHEVARRALVRDEASDIRKAVEALLADATVEVVVATGGTGVAPRDVTPDAVAPLFEKRLPGFGEIFRMLSWTEVGSAAMLSRAEAGVAAGKPVFLLPGSPSACRLAMERLILPETGHLAGLLRRG
jgi:molybdenum cofactor biosynthesis protein B